MSDTAADSNSSPTKDKSPPVTPNKHNSGDGFLVPSPIPTRRTRTKSMTERAADGPTYKGILVDFCRYKGHGFIQPFDDGELLFVHISDIDGDVVPKAGDEVEYKKCLVPPKNEKYCATHVRITHMEPGTAHETWDYSPMSKSS